MMRICVISMLLLSSCLHTEAQMIREDIGLSDPFIMPDPVSKSYFMTGTAGDIYRSKDLEVWEKLSWALNTNGIPWIGVNHTKPMPGQIWAPELYYKDGAYYDVVTFTNPNAKTEGTDHTRRSIHILKSNKPEGPYHKISGGDSLYLPASKMAIDGTIWEEDGHVYLVYCYEWVQAGDGAIEYIELKPDLTGTIGAPKHICNASDGRAWNTDAVTDGPFIFRTQNGRLGMIWTSWRSGVYVQGVSYSDNGKLTGKWSHSKTPVTPDNHGHGMMFRTFEGELLMSIHNNRNIDLANQHFERHPELFVMDDSGDELKAVMQYKHKYNIESPSKVVVINAGFDYSTNGWVCTTNAVNKKIASNQNGAITGKYYESWDSKSFTGEIYQELKLPNGTYTFTAAAFRSYLADGAADDDNAICLFANEEECCITSAEPKKYSVTVYVTDGKLKFGIKSKRKNYQWMGIDNAEILYYGDKKHTSEEIELMQKGENAVYLMNRQSGMYLNCGNSWGTQAILSKNPLDLYLLELPNGKYAINTCVDNGGGNHYVGSNGYMDSGMTEFIIKMKDSVICTLSTNGTQYWGCDNDLNISRTISSSASDASQWIVKRKSNLLSDFEYATINNPVNATFLISGASFGRNDTRVSSNWYGTYEIGGRVENQCVQFSSSSYEIYQTISDVPNGIYELRVQGFYRHGTASTAANYRSKGIERLNAYLFANDEKVPLMSIFEYADHPSISDSETDVTVLGRIPASMNSSSDIFSAGLYVNKLKVKVEDGNLKIGIRKNTEIPSGNWTVFDNFELYYLGQEMPDAIDNLNVEKTKEKSGVYDINGRKVNGSLGRVNRNNIYIIDGVKTYISGKEE